MKNTNLKPPKLAERFFKWLCRNELAESILGDLEEQFYYNLGKHGTNKAKLFYWFNMFSLINRYTLARSKTEKIKSGGVGTMLFHHLLISYRNLSRHKNFTIINIFGLAIGLASCLLIAGFLNNELSYDKFHDDSENIYRINHFFVDNSGTITKMANSAPALVPAIKNMFPEIKKATQMRYARRALLEYGEKSFYETSGFYADSSFFEVFSFPLVVGNKSHSLDEPNSIVISKQMAVKYFGRANPIGKIITMNGNMNLEVTGILEAVPGNSHLQFDFLVSFTSYIIPEGYLSDLTSWSWAGFLSYVRLADGSDPKILEKKINNMYKEMTPAEYNPDITYVQSLSDIYLGSGDLVDDLASNIQSGNTFTIFSLGTVALLILLIAGFNFMNLSIAVSATRYKEVGLRKMLGAERGSLISQLLIESLMLGLISLLLAYLFSWAAFQFISGALDWNFTIGLATILNSIPFAITATLLIGFGSGLYPAIFLSGHKAVAALKASIKNELGTGSNLRKVLTAFQFFISISLIAATIVITKQYQYLSDQKLGFDKENVVVMKVLPEDMNKYYDIFKDQLLKSNHIVDVSRTQRIMGEPWPINMISVNRETDNENKRILGSQVGYDFAKTMGINLIEGRSFSKDFSDDARRSVIINETTVKYLGLDNPVGTDVNYFNFDGPRKIIGVVEDFNFLSLHHQIEPMALVMPFVNIQNIVVRLSPGNLSEKISELKSIWAEINPGIPLEYRFMDDHLNQLYQNEAKLSGLIFGFSGLTVLLACMGLYGLIAFSLNQKRREMGIRKVLGASVTSLLVRFTRQYVILIGISSLVAIPVIQYILNLWLEGFAYRIEITWWVYIISMMALLFIALFTISHQAVSAALVNPVKVLQDE